ncbi:diphthine--ammonia ligase [Chitinophaga defluvii]|uniref:Diphthine--ammonia ligase n=1 Tax=Chitinophaga defluvii TaxID=3163343 RepID=A0ABV2T9P3_9BACT
MKPAFMNWSSGKDACFALWQLQQQREYDIRYLFTTLNAAHKRVSMHGVRESLLDEQARQIGIPLKKAFLNEHAAMEEYNDLMRQQMAGMLAEDIRYAVFGDIFLEDLKQYREKQLAQAGLQGIFPLWQQNTRELAENIVSAGFKAIIVCVNTRHLDESFVGRIIDAGFLRDLPPHVDPCGENGEFHSFVFDGPLFKAPVKFIPGETVERTYPAINTSQKGETSQKAPATWDHRFYFKELLEV